MHIMHLFFYIQHITQQLMIFFHKMNTKSLWRAGRVSPASTSFLHDSFRSCFFFLLFLFLFLFIIFIFFLFWFFIFSFFRRSGGDYIRVPLFKFF
ncbi:hypothetical protein HanIR_Chr02g0085661 [Helianthus annuus]|nr:hypothetical protein HanIR_Chr02g0085661 [Helianthus annuus]